MLSNPIFLEIYVKVHQKDLVEEAKIIRLNRSAKKNNIRTPFCNIEIFADLLIYVGEYLKEKYCSKTTITFNA